jgi:perosamine synthetase
MIPFYKPWFPPGSRAYAEHALRSGWVGKGSYINAATDKLKELFGYKYVLLTSSGTAAMMLVEQLMCNKGEIVYVPSNCYIAAVNPFYSRHLVRTYPMSQLTWNGYLPEDWKPETAHRFLLVVVHNLGNPVDVPRLKSRFPQALIIEDCCEALGATYQNRYVGTDAACAVFSFYSTKTVTSGEGGAFVTSDPAMYELAKLLATQGQGAEPYKHLTLGYNYRMSNLQAALLYGQLQHWDEIQQRKADLFVTYHQRLAGVVDLQYIPEDCRHSSWVTGVWIQGDTDFNRAKRFFDDVGIEIRPFFYPLNHHRHMSTLKIASPELAEDPSRHIILLPSYPALAREARDERDYIIEKVKEYAAAVE